MTTEVKPGSWVRIGDIWNGSYLGKYEPPKFGKVKSLAQNGMRAIVRLHKTTPLICANEWCGEILVDIGVCNLICRPEWDQ